MITAQALLPEKRLSGGTASIGVNRVKAEPRPAIRAEDRVRLAHINVDVWVILRRGHAKALGFLHPYADFGDAAVVPELRIAAVGHQVRTL